MVILFPLIQRSIFILPNELGHFLLINFTYKWVFKSALVFSPNASISQHFSFKKCSNFHKWTWPWTRASSTNFTKQLSDRRSFDVFQSYFQTTFFLSERLMFSFVPFQTYVGRIVTQLLHRLVWDVFFAWCMPAICPPDEADQLLFHNHRVCLLMWLLEKFEATHWNSLSLFAS